MYAMMNNRGQQIDLFTYRSDAQAAADDYNASNSDVFAWVIDAPDAAVFEDMPGRGVIYG